MTEEKPTGRTIRIEIRTGASAEDVYRAWADPEEIAHWFVDRAEGEAAEGRTITWYFDAFGYAVPYRVVAAEPGRRFALGGDIPGRGPFLLDVRIRKEAGETVVELVNSGFLDGAEWDDEYEGIHSGWKKSLAVLKHYLERHRGRRKTAVLAMAPAAFEYASLEPLFRSADGLSRWLASSAQVDEASGRYELALADGGNASGRLLVWTGRESVMSFDEVSGTIELMAFAAGQGRRMVGVRILSWDLPEDGKAGLDRMAERSVARLIEALASGPTG